LIAELAAWHYLVASWAENHLFTVEQGAADTAEVAAFFRATGWAEAILSACLD
jgi:hypothetical protein